MQFQESQRFRNGFMYFVYIVLSLFMLAMCYAFYRQVFLGKPFGDKPAPEWVLVLVILFLLVLILGLFNSRMETSIDQQGIAFTWKTLFKKRRMIYWNELESYDLFNYGFVGYGARISRKGMIYTMGGKTGLRLILKTGERIIIGTQKPEALQHFLLSFKPGSV